jgi:hypothetical protein
MKLALALTLIAAPAFAQETAPAPVPEEDGFSLVERGAKMVLRGLMTEMQPAIDEMGKAMEEVRPAIEGFGEEVGPKIRQLLAMIDDIANYDAPVMLPNGDILIRRNAPLEPKFDPKVPPPPGPGGEIEL